MRPRKRTDWPVVVYQYWVRLEHETWDALPARVRQEADMMRALWNHCVDVFSQRRALVQPADDSSRATPLTRTQPSSAQLQRHLVESLRQFDADSQIAWANKQFVLTRFQAAITRFYKKQNRPPGRKAGPPEEVHFHHRFTSGGLPVERIFGRGQRVHIEPVAPEAFDASVPQRQRKRVARTTGSFLVGDTLLPFDLILHRPLPPGAYLKSATLIGRQGEQEGYHRRHDGNRLLSPHWRWSLHCTLEIPPPAESLPERTEPVAAMNIHCQFVDDEHLRIAVLTDMGGREEAIFLPHGVIQSWRYKRTLQSRVDQFLAEVKTQLQTMRENVQIPHGASRPLARLDVISTAGLWRLLLLLESEDRKGELYDIVRRWGDQSARLLREIRGLEQHYLHHRDWHYHNTVLQLCQRYRRLVVSVAQGQEQGTAQQLAAPGRFLTFLVQTARKTNTEVQIEKYDQRSKREYA